MDKIYDFDSDLIESQLVEKITENKMYDIRKMSEQIKKIGRPLAIDETKEFLIKNENEIEK